MHKLNPDSQTTRQLYDNRQRTVQDYIARFRRGDINAVLPDEAKSITIEEALQAGRLGGINIRKLLIDNRDKFRRK